MLKHDSASGKLDLVKRTLITPHLGMQGWPQINCTSSFNCGFTVISLSYLSFSSLINKTYDESMCNKHAIILNQKRED